jgi:uncharacterized protein
MTVNALKDCSKKELAQKARQLGIPGWHAMRKDQLIRALAPSPTAERVRARPPKAPMPAASPRSRRQAPPPPSPRPSASDARTLDHGRLKDRIIVMVRDPYWLHAHWELSRATLARAQAAMGQDWHAARPVLRLMDVSSEDTTAITERLVRDVPIHGAVNNWYIDVADPPHSYRVDIGYLSRRGKFFVLARSNVVTTPRAGSSDLLDENWSNVERHYQAIFARSTTGTNASQDFQELFEERQRRPLNGLNLSTLGTGALGTPISRKFHFEIDAELVVYGSTEPNAKVTLQGEPVKLRPDGSFSVRFSLPENRQIIPAVSSSPDGVEERTIVLAVERNTKELEPMIHDGNEL